MSGRRRRFSDEFKVEAAHRVIDSGRPVSEVARESTIGKPLLGGWVRAERAELLRLRKQVVEQEKDLVFLGKGA